MFIYIEQIGPTASMKMLYQLCMTIDNPTLRYYARSANEFANRQTSGAFIVHQNRFIGLLKVGNTVLDLGCGCGRHGLAFKTAGLKVTPLDGSPELAKIASQRLGQDVVVSKFQDINFENSFHGVWASASLLHVPSEEISDVLAKVRTALKPKGVFVASFKEAPEDWHDANGRFFCAMSIPRLRDLLMDAGFQVNEITSHSGFGSDGAKVNWLWAFAERL